MSRTATRCSLTLGILLLATASSAWAQVIDHSGGFSSGVGLTVNGSAAINPPARPNVARLTPSAFGVGGSIWSTAQVNVQRFATTFTFQFLSGTFPMADGITFTVQRAGTGALGLLGGSLAYEGIPNSVCVKFDIYDGFSVPSITGIYTNGAGPFAPETYLNPTLDFHSHHVFRADLGYDGTTLQVTITDTATNVSLSQSYVINIPLVIGGGTAHVGFTGATGGLAAEQDVLTWKFWDGSTFDALLAAVTALIPGQLSATYGKLLLQVVDQAAARLFQNRPGASVTLLRSFIAYVNKFQNALPLALSPANALNLINLANALINGLSPGGP
ncbi:MAG: hypothetical protein HY293_11285 [Planctomycetes bacterium]|nr:hypothetical protein [Planctomycetota bacterium]